MQKKKTTTESTKKLVLIAILAAITAVLSMIAIPIPGTNTTLNLTLIVVVIGSALYGPGVGALLGGVSGVIILLSPASVGAFYSISVVGTILTVMIKGVLSGYLAGLAYKLLEKKNRYLAVIVAAIVCPIVNTGTFLIGCMVFFLEMYKGVATKENVSVVLYLLLTFLSINFLVELGANIVLSPAILRIINIKRKDQNESPKANNKALSRSSDDTNAQN